MMFRMGSSSGKVVDGRLEVYPQSSNFRAALLYGGYLVSTYAWYNVDSLRIV